MKDELYQNLEEAKVGSESEISFASEHSRQSAITKALNIHSRFEAAQRSNDGSRERSL
jgi:hypothetical protein